jgi:hypothetical protein
MPTTVPIAVAGDRRPKRAPPLPSDVKGALRSLVWGADGTEGRNPASLEEAAKAGDMKPDTLRRWLHRPEARSFIADERNAYLAWVTGANAQVLALIRDSGTNEAARVRAVLALEEMAGLRQRPGLSVNVGVQTNIATPIGYAYEPCNRPTIDAEPATPTPTIDAEPATPTPTIDAEPIIERPLAPTVVEYRRREAETAAEVAAERVAQHDRMNPVFRPRGY